MTRVVFLGLFAGVCVGPNLASAQVGPCSSEITQIESALRQPGSDVGPTLSQTIGAQLGRQPTPGAVKRAEARADARLKAALARARALSAKGDRAGCAKAVERIKLLIGM